MCALRLRRQETRASIPAVSPLRGVRRNASAVCRQKNAVASTALAGRRHRACHRRHRRRQRAHPGAAASQHAARGAERPAAPKPRSVGTGRAHPASDRSDADQRGRTGQRARFGRGRHATTGKRGLSHPAQGENVRPAANPCARLSRRQRHPFEPLADLAGAEDGCFVSRIFPGAEIQSEADVVSRRARARPRHRSMGGDRSASGAGEGWKIFRRRLRLDRHEILPRAVSLDVDGRRLCDNAAAQGRHAVDALSDGRPDRNESAGFGLGHVVGLALRRFALDQPGRWASPHRRRLQPHEISPRRRRDAGGGCRLRPLAPDGDHHGRHRRRDDRPHHHRRLADRALMAAAGAPQRRSCGNHRIRQGPRARRSRIDPPAGFGRTKHAFYRRRREHDAGTVHVRRRRPAGRVQRALRQDVPAAAGIAQARHVASRHHRPPCPQWPPEGRSRQRRRAAAIIRFVGAAGREKIEPDRRTCRRQADPRNASTASRRRLGRDPRRHHRAAARRSRSSTRPSNFWIRSSTTFRLRWS